MRAADFKLVRAAIELRFEPAYAIWDRVGAIWGEACHQWPELEAEQASPNQTVFLHRPKLQLQVELERILVVHHSPDELRKSIEEVTIPFVAIAKRHLEVEAYTRVGFRLIYRHDFESEQEASRAILSQGLISPPDPGIARGREAVGPSMSVRWEDEDTGVRLALLARKQVQKMKAPPDQPRIPVQEFEEIGAVVDVDHYTNGAVTAAQLDLATWLRDRERETRDLLGEILG